MRKRLVTALVWLLLIALFVLAWEVYQSSPEDEGPRPASYESFMELVKTGRVAEVYLEESWFEFTNARGDRFWVQRAAGPEVQEELAKKGIPYTWDRSRYRSSSDSVTSPLLLILFVIAIVGLVIWFVRRAGSGGANIMTLRRSQARLVNDDARVTFGDVGGCADAKAQLRDVIDYLRNPKRWAGAGVRLPRGVLLEGPPGCGKTLLARAVAGETSAKFYSVSASEFVELFVGVGAARVRDMFETASKNAPAVIFIDELDAVGRRRGSGVGLGHDEREQTLNQLLVCLDGFEQQEGVVALAATNRIDVLDVALLRPGRFDRRVEISSPDLEGRVAILAIHTKNKRLAPDVSLEAIAERTEGWNGAELESLANEAALLAVRRVRESEDDDVVVTFVDFEAALAPAEKRASRFDKLDALLIESETQLAHPTGRAVVRFDLIDGGVMTGEVIWADATMIKLRRLESDSDCDEADTLGAILLPKAQIKSVRALDGTESASEDEISEDRWSGRAPGTV